MKRKLARIGLMMVALGTLCSCDNESGWKYPKELYIGYPEYNSNNTQRYMATFKKYDEHTEIRYKYDGCTLEVREKYEMYGVLSDSQGFGYVGTWGEESIYQYVNCPFWAVFQERV